MNNNVTDMIITRTAGIGKSRFFAAMNEGKNPSVTLNGDLDSFANSKKPQKDRRKSATSSTVDNTV